MQAIAILLLVASLGVVVPVWGGSGGSSPEAWEYATYAVAIKPAAAAAADFFFRRR